MQTHGAGIVSQSRLVVLSRSVSGIGVQSKQAGLAYQHERAGRVIGMSNDGSSPASVPSNHLHPSVHHLH